MAAAETEVFNMIFQLGTNNWQRPMKGNGELEFAPGSGVLHEAHHNAYNATANVKSYSMYPSKNQAQPTDPNADYRVFELDHDIPICESASPNSSKRWHSMDDKEFNAYVSRLENEVYDYMKACEAREGKKFHKGCSAPLFHQSSRVPTCNPATCQGRATQMSSFLFCPWHCIEDVPLGVGW